ncbi:MAG: (d)CMP kinase [Bacteroidota bacterium]|nr:(d)CMP kinase [Bacteroidota bacterium]MDX5429021.1 (d)CMP kinase [Bacteroidota bacterium]MDX5447796.1 (d)CMP kinase [Bacteroidota bacterium]MDX5506685.1 (d)CMP kinase [Bacteroidota bacterium]
MKKITIAIDGFSSTGKSTLAKNLARALGYSYVDTGAMYRSVALYALKRGMLSDEHLDRDLLIRSLPHIQITFKFDPETQRNLTFLNGENVEDSIRGMEVSNLVTRISGIPEVRQELVAQQQEMGKNKGVVMDGRDIGTVVFPKAELKIFMTADPDVRIDRRYQELLSKGIEVTRDEVRENLRKRDAQDTSREDSPLIMANDAKELDNSHLSVEDQFEIALKWARERIG